MKQVVVVTFPDSGWDCIIGVFDENVNYNELELLFPSESGYVLHYKWVHTNLNLALVDTPI